MLKLVIVVLTGIGLSTEKDDVIFALSMATSFGALIYFGLQESIQIRDASNTKPEHLEKDIRSLLGSISGPLGKYSVEIPYRLLIL